jgi:repressor LexA
MECIEDIIDTEEISDDMLKGGKEYFGLKIKGQSMIPAYYDGDIIIFEKTNDCESGQDCVVMVNGNDGTFKRVFKNENGIILQPLNPEFQPIIYTNQQIQDLPVRIIGIAREIRRKL